MNNILAGNNLEKLSKERQSMYMLDKEHQESYAVRLLNFTLSTQNLYWVFLFCHEIGTMITALLVLVLFLKYFIFYYLVFLFRKNNLHFSLLFLVGETLKELMKYLAVNIFIIISIKYQINDII